MSYIKIDHIKYSLILQRIKNELENIEQKNTDNYEEIPRYKLLLTYNDYFKKIYDSIDTNSSVLDSAIKNNSETLSDKNSVDNTNKKRLLGILSSAADLDKNITKFTPNTIKQYKPWYKLNTSEKNDAIIQFCFNNRETIIQHLNDKNINESIETIQLKLLDAVKLKKINKQNTLVYDKKEGVIKEIHCDVIDIII